MNRALHCRECCLSSWVLGDITILCLTRETTVHVPDTSLRYCKSDDISTQKHLRVIIQKMLISWLAPGADSLDIVIPKRYSILLPRKGTRYCYPEKVLDFVIPERYGGVDRVKMSQLPLS